MRISNYFLINYRISVFSEWILTSLFLKDNKTNSGKITCKGNRSVTSVPSLTLRALPSHFSAQHPNFQAVPRRGNCSQLRHYRYATVQPESIKIPSIRKHPRDESYACDERDSYFMKLYFPIYFCILPLATFSFTKQPFHTRSSNCNRTTFLFAKSSYYAVVHPSNHVKVGLKFII